MRLPLLFLFLFILSVASAQKIYRGIVVDSSSLTALPNVHVAVKHSSRGTVTNNSGVFILNVSAADTLVLSLLGYREIELALFTEEDALLIRMSENIKMLSEITIKATRLYPNEIANRTREAPRKMSGYQALESPFTYFSKREKEKRKIYRFVEESNKTQTYVQVITDPVVKEIFTKDYELTDEAYYDLIAKFNEQNRFIAYSTDPEEIMEVLHAFFRNKN